MHRLFRAFLLFGSLILSELATGSAHADTCPPLKLLDQIQMVPENNGIRLMLPVTMNGVAEHMLFDTGTSISSVTRALTQELGLSAHPSLHAVLYDIDGDASYDVTSIADFKFGQQEIRNAEFQIWPGADLRTADPLLAGIFTHDQLRQYDIDVDFAHGVLKLFSPDHCKGDVLYWKPAAVAEGEFDTRHGHINVEVTLDGQRLNGYIDSGAVHSLLSADSARRLFGLTHGSPETKQAGMAQNNPQDLVYPHRFAKLEFDGVVVNNPDIAILPNIIGRSADRSQQSTGNRAIPRNTPAVVSQLIIGMDILRKLHIYIAFREGRLYIAEVPANSLSSK
jgi:predicted aspartyl protease